MKTLDLPADSIPFTRLDNHEPALMSELLAAVERVARSASFIGGPEVEQFEEEFATYCETSECVGVSSGTEALHLGLRALGIGPGDEVVVPANSFIATAEAVNLAGATPRFADVDADSQLVTTDTIAAAMGPNVRCIIVVHLFGRTVDLAGIQDLARSHGVPVVEDACQAHGARVHGRRVGGLAAFAAFSFYPAKNLGAWGDGGALTTLDSELADRVRLLRSHGERPRYHHRVVGTTARLDALQAAILRVKLGQLEGWNEARRRVAAELCEHVNGSEVHAPPPPGANADHVYHQFVVRCGRRDALRDHLSRHGVATGVHYPIPIHRSEAYRSLNGREDPAPVATSLADQICSLPIFPTLKSAEVARIGEVVASFGNGN